MAPRPLVRVGGSSQKGRREEETEGQRAGETKDREGTGNQGGERQEVCGGGEGRRMARKARKSR